jgi:hypothetical protein
VNQPAQCGNIAFEDPCTILFGKSLQGHEQERLPGQRCDVAGGGDEAGGGAEVAAADDAGGGGNEARGGAEVAAAVFAGFSFMRAAGGFMAAGANGSSSAMTGSGVMTVFEAMPASPDCMELDSFTAMRTGTLCGW